MLLNELCLAPYHTTALIVFLESIQQDYHHFFVRCSSMMSDKDLGEFIEIHTEVASRLVEHFVGGKKATEDM